jgi:hypothetical protein
MSSAEVLRTQLDFLQSDIAENRANRRWRFVALLILLGIVWRLSQNSIYVIIALVTVALSDSVLCISAVWQTSILVGALERVLQREEAAAQRNAQ